MHACLFVLLQFICLSLLLSLLACLPPSLFFFLIPPLPPPTLSQFILQRYFFYDSSPLLCLCQLVQSSLVNQHLMATTWTFLCFMLSSLPVHRIKNNCNVFFNERGEKKGIKPIKDPRFTADV